MTLEQLRSIFHVESQDLVPHYEVIHLTHHGTVEHKLSKRSIATASSAISLHQNNQFDDPTAHKKSDSHHVKKDLSKSTYYSELKKTSSTVPLPKQSTATSTQLGRTKTQFNSELNRSNTNSNNSLFSSNIHSKLVKNSLSNSEFYNEDDKNQYKSQFTLPSKEVSQSEKSESSDFSDSDEKQTKQNLFSQMNLDNIKEHNVSLNVFGQVFNLTLRPTKRLFKDGPQSLQMFTVIATPNATNGLSYEPIEEVSNFSSLTLYFYSFFRHILYIFFK